MTTSQPRLSILIATIGQRKSQLRKLLDILFRQIRDKPVEIVAYWNNGERPMGEIRQALVDEAKGEYICFIDDDDEVPAYYVDRILKALGKDYVGWRMQAWHDGVKLKPTFHSIKYSTWYDDDNGFYRNISHLNPIKRSLALQISFETPKGIAEDEPWANRIAPLVKSENYIDDVMYFYHHTTGDSLWRGNVTKNKEYERLIIKNKQFRWHPLSKRKHVPGQ